MCIRERKATQLHFFWVWILPLSMIQLNVLFTLGWKKRIKSVSVQMAPGKTSWSLNLLCASVRRMQNWWYNVWTVFSQVCYTNVTPTYSWIVLHVMNLLDTIAIRNTTKKIDIQDFILYIHNLTIKSCFLLLTDMKASKLEKHV